MKQYVVAIKRYGDFDMPYTDKLLIGDKKPQELYDSFRSELIKNKDVYGYIATNVENNEGEDFSNYLSKMSKNQEQLSKELEKHFKDNGYKEYSAYEIKIGD